MSKADYNLASNNATIGNVTRLLSDLRPSDAIPAHELLRVNRLLALWKRRTYVAMGEGDDEDKRELARWEQEWALDK